MLPSLNTVVLSGFEGAASVKGARPPRTKSIPTGVGDASAPGNPPEKPSPGKK